MEEITPTPSLDTFALRAELVAEGWESEDRLGIRGWGIGSRGGYTIWLRRYDWHGRMLGNAVTFSASSREPEGAAKAVERVAALARRAWKEFPDSIPVIDARGNIVEDQFATKFWREARAIDDPTRREEKRTRHRGSKQNQLIQIACRGCGARSKPTRETQSRWSAYGPPDSLIHRLGCPMHPPSPGPVNWRRRTVNDRVVWVGLAKRENTRGWRWEVATAKELAGERLAFGLCGHDRSHALSHALDATRAFSLEGWDPAAGANAIVACSERSHPTTPLPHGRGSNAPELATVYICQLCGVESEWDDNLPHRLACPSSHHHEDREGAPEIAVRWRRIQVKNRPLQLGLLTTPGGTSWEVATGKELKGNVLLWGFGRDEKRAVKFASEAALRWIEEQHRKNNGNTSEGSDG